MLIRNSSLSLVFSKRLFTKSMASIGFISARYLRRIHIRSKVVLSSSKSSRRVRHRDAEVRLKKDAARGSAAVRRKRIKKRETHGLHRVPPVRYANAGQKMRRFLVSAAFKKRTAIFCLLPARGCGRIALLCGHDEIGRHARFRFSCFTALGFESPCPHQK